MSEFEVADKVIVRGWAGEYTIFEFAKTMAIVADKFRSLHVCDINAMTIVKPKEAPPKFTKVYVWDGDRPQYPKIAYSSGIFYGIKLQTFEVCSAGKETFIYPYLNWEVIE